MPGRGDMFLGQQSRSIAGPDYRLGPGDVLDVQIVGRLDVTRVQIVVDPEGAIALPPLGTIRVAGLTLLEANRQITDRARSIFRYADVSIAVVSPRSFEVVVSGEVERPGTLQVLATQRLHEVILTAGGITPRGSARHVQVMREGATREIDLLVFELKGDVAQNPFVQEGMRIIVPPRVSPVTLTGAVRRPGEYEPGPGGSLRELLDLTGGVSVGGAPGDARLTRVGPDERKQTTSVDLRRVLAGQDIPLRAGDMLYVPPLTSIQDVVEVRGAFNGTTEAGKTLTQGKATIVQRLELARGERMRDVVVKAGGVAAFADLRLAFVDRSDAGPAQRIPVDLHRLLVDKDETQNILIQNGDIVVAPVIEDKVYIVGEVKNPGAQDFRPDLTAREYLAAAGGPGSRAKVKGATVTFRNGRTYAMAEAPPLEAGAVVTVPEVAVKWWQDYVTIANLIAGLVTAYTGVFILFNGPLKTSTDSSSSN
ncbi:MAG TPA: SLBB domain-containing protein [Methylomirabilota bacterium]|jgi:protein involved in polysaccharide export with SLBB domain|nr:SLBB domain-containing protein [Methylomirabilota bacterium]